MGKNDGAGHEPVMLASFEAGLQHGCLVFRDTESDGDVSAWDPAESGWYADRGSAIFGVRPGVEGHVRCEVWLGIPLMALPVSLFAVDLCIDGALEVEDPGGVVRLELRIAKGPKKVAVLVDDALFATQVQLVVLQN